MKIGVFVCHCGSNIEATVDTAEVARIALTYPDVAHAEDSMYTCSEPGQDNIVDAIKKYGLDGVVVASCSPRMHEQTFRRTVEALQDGDPVIVFPDVDYTDRSGDMGEIYDGFLLIDRFWQRVSDTPLDFVPLRLDRKEYPEFEQALDRCKDIVNYLNETLDGQYEISHELARMYEYFDYQLIRIKLGRNKEALEHLQGMFGELQDARVQEAAYAQQLAALQETNRQLQEDLDNAGNLDLIEDIARDQLGLVRDGEKVFRYSK